jgi:hypothetical protein
MNKNGQIISVIAFIGVVATLIILSPFLIKIVSEPVSKFSAAMSSVDATNKSSDAINFISDTYLRWFDWVIFFIFLFNVVLILVSSFLVDVHPVWFIIYVIAAFIMVLFAPSMSLVFEKIYTSDQYSSTLTHIPFTNFIYENFMYVILGVIIISAIIMYGKYRFFGSGSAQSGGGY